MTKRFALNVFCFVAISIPLNEWLPGEWVWWGEGTQGYLHLSYAVNHVHSVHQIWQTSEFVLSLCSTARSITCIAGT